MTENRTLEQQLELAVAHEKRCSKNLKESRKKSDYFFWKIAVKEMQDLEWSIYLKNLPANYIPIEGIG